LIKSKTSFLNVLFDLRKPTFFESIHAGSTVRLVEPVDNVGRVVPMIVTNYLSIALTLVQMWGSLDQQDLTYWEHIGTWLSLITSDFN
jgi:hypothetical protein